MFFTFMGKSIYEHGMKTFIGPFLAIKSLIHLGNSFICAHQDEAAEKIVEYYGSLRRKSHQER